MRLVILDILYKPWLVVLSLLCAADGRLYLTFFMLRSDPKYRDALYVGNVFLLVCFYELG